ncbi:division/cell wall cluster transcriptional repressor MraZ [Cellulomonas endophytica]|uniref:division/cell wall cluster transcriptional repressor MraZ n=1 Tax=Cellulomonas endophytica TaxID=2494735 RepID=UPI001F0BBCBD|nr:division/cell wall cluster transcriptional repressor MraZ [Cellulomonas endophytica]
MSDEPVVGGVLGLGAPFLGTYTPRLDEKGRVVLPAKFRARLAGGLVMTRGQERCLYLLPPEEFGRIHGALSSNPLLNRQSRDYLRVFLSGASDELPDKQGRLSIPPVLRRYAGLERDVAVIGTGNRVEIWDLPSWETYLAEKEAGYAEAAEEGFPQGAF